METGSLVGTGLQRGSLPEELLQGPGSICFQGDAASNWTHCLRRDAAPSSQDGPWKTFTAAVDSAGTKGFAHAAKKSLAKSCSVHDLSAHFLYVFVSHLFCKIISQIIS